MESILLSKYSVSNFTQAFLAVLITVYLLTSANKNCSAWRLIVFFGAISGSMVSSFLLMAINAPARVWFGPIQMLVSFAGMVAITQFAYTFPGGESSRRSKRAAVAAFVGLLAVAATVSLTYDARREVSLIVMSGAFALYTFWPIVVFTLQARSFSREAVGGPVSIISALRHPVGREAQAHRAFALLMSVLLVLSLLAFAESLSLISLQRLISSLASIYILFLVSFVFVYVNNAPTPSTFMAKLVGIPLVTLLLVMGNMGAFVLETLEARFDEDRKAELKFALKSVVEEDFAFLPKHVNSVYVYPLESLGGIELREAVYRNPDKPLSDFHDKYQAPVFTKNVIEIMRRDKSVDPNLAKEWALEQINRTDVLSWSQELGFSGMIQDLRCSVYYFTVTGFLFEVTYDRMFYGRYIDSYASGLILFILGSTIVILLLFPKFFKSSLNGPLQSLLGGMRAVNDGDMTVEVPVHTEDEFGFLTRSFNGMVSSIRVAEDRLKGYATELEEANQTLESRVEDRTRDLNEKNIELEQTLVELQETQNQLLLQEKMASVGQLVAGLAHEINNPIGVVSSSADVARRCVVHIDQAVAACETIDDLRENPKFQRSLSVLRDNIDVTTQAGDRIKNIVVTLRNFARLDEAEHQIVRLEEGIESTIALMRHQIPETIAVETQFAETPPIYCSPGELNQVFMSLIRNAVNAISDVGRIQVLSAIDDNQVKITISDDGVGIPKDRLDRIFEIGFSSTRDRVKMGTGLTTAYRVVNEHRGMINIDSEVGKGTTVSLYLPVERSV